MIEWRDDAVILERRRHGESHALVDLFARSHGRWRGLVHGGASTRLAPLIEPGNHVVATWRARLAEQLGHFLVEPQHALLPHLLGEPLRVKVWQAARHLLLVVLPERHPYQALYSALEGLCTVLALESVSAGHLGEALARFELAVIASSGFALALDRCAVTGGRQELVYVSPRTGRAVCRRVGEPYAPRLLPLPRFLRPDREHGRPPDHDELADAFRLTGHFLDRHVFAAIHQPPPAARADAISALLAAAEREAAAHPVAG
ncbi:MAG: DNA repair protein RecO [Alphaproteobacteria bacterium]|nr:MAG: DNA repair protein RecO [Alphaproteobacteria bacterium]